MNEMVPSPYGTVGLCPWNVAAFGYEWMRDRDRPEVVPARVVDVQSLEAQGVVYYGVDLWERCGLQNRAAWDSEMDSLRGLFEGSGPIPPTDSLEAQQDP